MIGVVTDSAANLPRSLADEQGVEVVPLYLTVGDRTLRDGAGHDPSDRLGDVTTSAPSPGDFAEAFERLGGEGIVCVTVGAHLSASHGSASIAAAQAATRVEVVDSRLASMAQGFVVLAAAGAARAGAGIDEVVAVAHRAAGRAGLVATIDTLEHLRRSGRVKAVVAWAASALDIKPVLRMRAGEIAGVARPRTRRKALDRVARMAIEEIAGRPARLAAVHAAAEEEAGELLDRVASQVQTIETHLVGFTPVLGAHTGPGVVGIAYLAE